MSAVVAAVAGAAAPAAAAGAADPNVAAPQQGGGLMGTVRTMMRMFIFWTAIKFVMQQVGLFSAPATHPGAATGQPLSVSHAVRPAWADGTVFDVLVYVTASPHWTAQSFYAATPNADIIEFIDTHLLWTQPSIRYEGESWRESLSIRESNLTLTEPFLSMIVNNNASLYSHVYVTRHGRPHAASLARLDSDTLARLAQHGIEKPTLPYDPLSSYSATHPLTVYRPKPKVDNRKNLLSGERVDGRTQSEIEAEATQKSQQLTHVHASKSVSTETVAEPWLAYWKPTLHLRLVHDFTVYPSLSSLPPEIKNDFIINHDSNLYYPTLYVDDWWLLSSHLVQVNGSVLSLPLTVSYSPIHAMKYRLERTMEQSWRMQESLGTHNEAETESLKKILLESNPYLLAVTMVVSLLHMVFDFLAFKNDIQYWKDTKNTGGMSSRSILIGFVCHIVIFLYLADNETSYMILVSSGIGLVIEAWKIRKAFDVSVNSAFPFVHIANKKVNVDESGEAVTSADQLLLLTQRYDAEAMTYLSYALYPLMLCYAVYSLYYNSHKSWYSFVISTLVGAVYTFGFIQMTPQLYINYKLQSVAHMPWRMMTYKALNTFIDDLFAFVITMPTLHRLSTFRDDIIFLIFIWQKWRYRVDDQRPNEFGLTGKQIKEAEMRKKQGLTGAAQPAVTTTPAPATPAAASDELKESALGDGLDDASDAKVEAETVSDQSLRQRRAQMPATATH